MPSCGCLNDSTGTPCKGYVKKDETICARHQRKPCENFISLIKIPKKTTIKKETRKKIFDRLKKEASEEKKPIIKKPTIKKETRKKIFDKLKAEEAEEERKTTAKKTTSKKENFWEIFDRLKIEEAEKRKTTPEKPMIKKETRKKIFDRLKTEEEEKKPKKDENVQKQSISNMEKIYNLTNQGYRFPAWIFTMFKSSINFEKYMEPAIVYALLGNYSKDILMKLVMEREPVNIAGSRPFDHKKMKAEFGWDVGYYNRYYEEEKKLAPNIAIFTPSAVQHTAQKTVLWVNILNVIGLAFDTKDQVDYQYFFGSRSKLSVTQAKVEILEFYKGVFKLIFKCANDHYLDQVVLSAFGMGFFKKWYPGDMFSEIYMVALKTEATKFRGELLFMGFGIPELKQIIAWKKDAVDVGLWPFCVTKLDNSRCLFLNAWDGLASPGNGNEGDNSLDGYVGRSTSIAVTGTGMTNPYLRDETHYILV
jgi:hypothetical protein